MDLLDDADPTEIVWAGDDRPAEIRLANGTVTGGVCIRCSDAPCIEYAETELTIEGVPAFPGDSDRRVCPTDAITWPTGNATPIIETGKCISCGLCIRRCPVAAIHLVEGKAKIETAPTGIWREAPGVDDEASRRTAARFWAVPRSGSCAIASEANLQRVQEAVIAAKDEQDAQFPNHLARNLLIAVGHKCAMRRRGDVNVRMDLLVGVAQSIAAVGEVEADVNAMIDTPRNILDDAAIMLARYGLPREQLRALVVGFALPNQRSEYWQIIRDIASVTELKINTFSIGALIMAVWAGVESLELADNQFYTGDLRTIRPALAAALGDTVTLPTGFLGILESQK